MALYLAIRLFYSLGVFYLPYELISSLWACFCPLKRLYFCIFAYNGIKPGISRYFLSNFAKFSPIIAPPLCVSLCVPLCVLHKNSADDRPAGISTLYKNLPASGGCSPRLGSARNIHSAVYVKVIGAAPGYTPPPLLGYL